MFDCYRISGSLADLELTFIEEDDLEFLILLLPPPNACVADLCYT